MATHELALTSRLRSARARNRASSLSLPRLLRTADGRRSTSAHEKPVWFITGCSTGFGRELSVSCSRAAIASSPRRATRPRSRTLSPATPRMALRSRSTSTSRVRSTPPSKRPTARFGRIDVLVNNAGYGYLAAVEEGDDADIRAMFETNFFGLAAMTRAVLPIMRAQKSGAIVNISSVGGFIGFPGSGYYAATKFAVEGLSESLSKEVGPFGIKVSSSSPGLSAPTGPAVPSKRQRNLIEAYAETAIARRHDPGHQRLAAGDPVRASEAIIATVEKGNPPLRLLSAVSPMMRSPRRSRPSARKTRRLKRSPAAPTIRRRAERRSRASAAAGRR